MSNYRTSDLTLDEIRRILAYDPITGVFTRLQTTSKKLMNKGPIEAGGLDSDGYRKIAVNGTIFLAHRLAWLLSYGCWPDEDIDHENGDTSDNRLCNLRSASDSENLRNRGPQKNNTSGYKNVSWCRAMGKWVVRLRTKPNGRYEIIGYFDNKEEANSIAVATRKKSHMRFAFDNRRQ
jgi:hypothetical protein